MPSEASATFKNLLALAVHWLTLSSTTMFLWLSGVAGLFAGIVDFVQFFRYSSRLPKNNFNMNLVAGISACLMLSFSIRAIVRFYRKSPSSLWSSIAISSAMAFVLAFLPRPPIGSAVSGELFVYIGGLGVFASLLVYHSVPSPDTPHNTP